ncbi:hypothetical protein HAALTHF_22140n [Vreelandella aquamarina]|nr:hypothetical protein HAALTHF_22140n [Halomonas axialensis]
MAHDLLDRLRERLEELNRSERKVANVILEDPAAATSLSIASLAQAASVSEPTVNRFCRNFGAKGYPDFKIKLAQSLAGARPTSPAPLSPAILPRSTPIKSLGPPLPRWTKPSVKWIWPPSSGWWII